MVVVFLMIAIMGLWSTFDKEHGFARFVLISLSAVAFVLLLHERQMARWYAMKAMAILAILLSSGLLLSSLAVPTLDRLGLRLPGPLLEANAWFEPQFPAGMLVISMPILTLERRLATRRREVGSARFWLAAILLALTAIVATGSLASISTLLLAGLLIAMRILGSELVRRIGWSSVWPRTVVWSVGIAVAVAVILVGVRVVGTQVGSAFVAGRLELAQQSARLAGDFLVTGGGLGSIPGLYGHYIRGLPVQYAPHSQNLYVNVLLELGLIGLLAFLTMYTASGYLLLQTWKRTRDEGGPAKYVSAACLAGIGLILLQGLIDDPFYVSWGLPVLLVLPGMAVSLANDHRDAQTRVPVRTLALVAVVPVILTAANWQAARAAWYANLGAVEMAKIELRGWPSDNWSDGRLAPLLHGSEARFLEALAFQPENRTALHRLGLIAMEGRDYRSAVTLLSQANELDPHHRGIRKALGYSLVWTGGYKQAEQLLSEIPEAERELMIYQGWWSSHGRPDLSQHSGHMLALLHSQ